MGTSPTKSDSSLASPKLGPTGGRRGHSHRRSAAISSHDLSSIMLPSPSSGSAVKAGSAPASPALLGAKDDFKFPNPADRSEQPQPVTPAMHQSDMEASIQVTPPDDQHTPKPVPRSRVGFSDTLEFIPRPLSFVSSDTSSTATAQPGHSVSGSISSVVSLSIPMEAEKEAGSLSTLGLPLVKSDSRPSTAGAVLERTQTTQDIDQVPHSPRRRNSIPHLTQIPPSTAVDPSSPSPTKTAKKWSFFGLEPFAGPHPPTCARTASSSSSDSQTNSDTTDFPPSVFAHEQTDEVEASTSDRKQAVKKRSKKHKKVKTWAGSILSRKSKNRHVKAKRRTPTPPPRDRDWEIEDDDFVRASIEIPTGSVMPTVMITEASAPEAEDSWVRLPRVSVTPEDDSSFPMIDLDAALGPFNTPLPRNPEWEAAQRAGGLVKKQLHSAAGMSRFTGPGMHYQHRRTESAPEMVPFEGGRFGIHRFGSSSTMADVFEEDEEEDDSDINKTTGQSTPMPKSSVENLNSRVDNLSGNPVPEVSTDDTTSDLRFNASRRKGSDVSDDERSLASSRIKSEHAGSSLHDEVIVEEGDVPSLPQIDPRFTSGNDSCGSAAPSPRHLFKPKDLAPVEVNPLDLPTASLTPASPYSATQSSAFPSPRTPSSYDAHRISTAPSSVTTEDNFQSLLMGEPGPEVRISVDDIPSLTSSNSAMTRESAPSQNPQARYPALGNQPRPASCTSTAFGRRRSSLASLNRLISSSHGERSKLSMEVPLDDEQDHRPKVSKTKRLSRMVQFWKHKEDLQT